jgi:hypothetical protein
MAGALGTCLVHKAHVAAGGGTSYDPRTTLANGGFTIRDIHGENQPDFIFSVKGRGALSVAVIVFPRGGDAAHREAALARIARMGSTFRC